MDFLRENKDILFEMSKYLSTYDLKNLKFAFAELDLKNILLARDNEFLMHRLRKKPNNICEMVQYIFTYGYDKFIFYNRTYDSRNGILICDVDCNEFVRFYPESLKYIECCSVIIFDDYYMIKFRNAYQLANTHRKCPIVNSYIYNLACQGDLDKFIRDNTDRLSLIDDAEVYQLSCNSTRIIWDRLPRKNQLLVVEQLRKFLAGDISAYGDNYILMIRNWLKKFE